MEKPVTKKLFLSYGHDDNAVVVEKLAGDLTKFGYYVFIDKSELKEGDHWRRIITERILESDMILAFASRHSIRNPGVCLDELNIASSVFSARIQSILLEKGIEPPANLGELNYIDMSDWTQHYSKENGLEQEWYNYYLEMIIRIINDPKNKEYAEEMRFLKTTLRPNISDTIRITSTAPHFYGRKWLKTQVGSWIDNKSDGRFLIIHGAPGIGKSAFVMNLYFSFEVAMTAIYCRSGSKLDSPEEILKLLIIKMCSTLPDYRTHVVSRLKADTSCLHSLNSMMHVLFIDPLSLLIDGSRMMHYILIDGLDELDSFDGWGRRYNPLASALVDPGLDDIKDYLRFIITCRSEPAILDRFIDYPHIKIDQDAEENLADIREYVEAELSEKLKQLPEEKRIQCIDNIVNASEGIILYCTLLIREIIKNQRSLTDMSLPNNLYNLYLDGFNRVFRSISESDYEKTYKPAISILAARDEKIPERTLKRACGWNKKQELKFYENVGEYLVRSEASARFFHKSLTDWLFTPQAGSSYGLGEEDRNEAAELLIKACYSVLKTDVHNLNEYELLNIIPLVKEVIASEYKSEHAEDMIEAILHSTDLLNHLCTKAEECISQYEFSRASDLLHSIDLFTQLAEERSSINSKDLYKAEVLNFYFKGRIADSQDHLNHANKEYENALNKIECHKLDVSDYHPLLFAHAFSYYRLSQYDKAISIYVTIINSDPERTDDVLEAEIGRSRCYRVNYGKEPDQERLAKAWKILESAEKAEGVSEILHACPRLYFKLLLHKAWTLDNMEDVQAMNVIKQAENVYRLSKRHHLDRNSAVEPGDAAMLYYVKAKREMAAEQYDSAICNIQKAIETFSSIYGKDTLRVTDFIDLHGIAKETMGDKYNDQNLYQEAESLFLKSLNIKERTYKDEVHASIMYSLDNLIRVRIKLNRPADEIAALIERNRTINQNRHSADEIEKAKIDRELTELKKRLK